VTAEETAAKIMSKVELWWPLAEGVQLRTAAGGFAALAVAVRKAASTGSSGAWLVSSGNSGNTIDAFDWYWAKYDGDGEAGLPATAQAADNVAAALNQFADKVDEAKHKIINLAIEIGATIAVGVGLALFTVGTSAGAAAARTAMLVARALTIAAGLSGVVSTIVATMLVGAVFGAVEGFTSSIIAQIGKATLSDGKGISLAETMAWTGLGAAVGPLVGGAGLAAGSALRAMAASDNTLLARIGKKFSGAGTEVGTVKPAAGPPTPAAPPPRVTASGTARRPALSGPPTTEQLAQRIMSLIRRRRPTSPPGSIPPPVSPHLVPLPIVREGMPLPTQHLDPRFVGENIATIPNRHFYPSTVRYMTAAELEAHRVVVINGALYHSDGRVLHMGGPGMHGNRNLGIFVMDEHGNLFVSFDQPGFIHHSSFLSGRPVAGSGDISVENGKIVEINWRSGHYPGDLHKLYRVLDQLYRRGLDLSGILIDGFGGS